MAGSGCSQDATGAGADPRVIGAGPFSNLPPTLVSALAGFAGASPSGTGLGRSLVTAGWRRRCYLVAFVTHRRSAYVPRLGAGLQARGRVSSSSPPGWFRRARRPGQKLSAAFFPCWALFVRAWPSVQWGCAGVGADPSNGPPGRRRQRKTAGRRRPGRPLVGGRHGSSLSWPSDPRGVWATPRWHSVPHRSRREWGRAIPPFSAPSRPWFQGGWARLRLRNHQPVHHLLAVIGPWLGLP
jgi:hypothetical protein